MTQQGDPSVRRNGPASTAADRRGEHAKAHGAECGRMSYFTYDAIIGLLSHLHQSHGLFPLREWRGQAGIVLRHDVDLDVEPAFRLARRQLEAGIRGSYFFLVTASTYNCQSRANRAMLREMAQGGMEIGLHFDPSIYPESAEADLDRRARSEAGVLEDIVGQRVASVSLHNPSVDNRYPMLPGWNNAYDPAIFNSALYLSDSRMQFREDPLAFFAQASERTHQLLLHPMHYGQTEPRYPAAKLAYVRRLVDTLHETFRVNTTYQREVGDRLVQMLEEDIRSWKK